MIAAGTLDTYRAQRDGGASAEQVYAQGFHDGLNWYDRLDVLETLFPQADATLRDVAVAGHRLACARYLALHQGGESLAAIAQRLQADGFSRLEAVFTLHALFGLRGPEAMRLLG